MNQITTTKKVKSSRESQKTLESILEELRLLRNEVSLFFPQDHLEDYAHPERIARAYQKTTEQYPPISTSWR